MTDAPSSPARLTALRLWLVRTVTPLGWFVLIVTLLGLLFALGMGLVEYGVLAVLGIILFLIALPFLLGRSHAELSIDLPRDRVTVGAGAQLDVTVVNTASRPLFPGRVEVAVDDQILAVRIPYIAGNTRTTIAAAVDTPQRRLMRIGPATMVRQDPLGMFRRARTDARVLDLYVHPETVVVPSSSVGLIRDLDGNATSTIVDSDISFHAIRPYASGDAQRHIHWKSTAKTGGLMVKQFEETKRSRLALLLATSAAEFTSPGEFELAVSVAGSLASRAIADGRETEVLISPTVDDRRSERDRRVRSLKTVTSRTLLDSLTTVTFGEGLTSVEHLGARAAETRHNASLVIIVTGAPVDYRTLRSATSPFGPDVRTVAVLCDASAQPGVQSFGALTVLRVGVLNDLQQLLIRGALS